MTKGSDSGRSVRWAHLNQWMFESSPDCVKLLDLDGLLLDMNLNGQCAMEIDDIAHLCGQEWRAFWPAQSHIDIEAALVAARAGQVGRFNAFCPTAKGSPRWWDVTVTPIRGDSGHVDCILSVSRDITALHTAEEEQRESAERLQFLLEAAQVGEWSLDLADGRAQTSRLHDRCFGYDEPVGTWCFETFIQHVHPNDRQRVEDTFRRVAAELREWQFECRVIWPDRSVHWISGLGNIYGSAGGQAGRMVGTVTDITRRKRAEMLAEGQKAALELAVAGAPLRSILDVLARTAEEGVGETIIASVMLVDEDARCLRHGSAPSLPESYSSAIDGLEIGPAMGSCGTAAFLRKPVIVTDIKHDPLWADFRHVALANGLRSCWSQPILSSQGEVLGTLAAYRTEPCAPSLAEREAMGLLLSTASLVLDRHRQALERQQAEAALRQLAEALSTADRRKTEFLATLAHELRNPLAPILNGIEAMKLNKNDLATQERIRDMVARQAMHMTHLIDDLLDVARITSGKLDLRKEQVVLQDIVATAVDTSLPLIEAGAHELSIHMPELPLWLEADPTRIAQAISNLLNNAAKYTARGGHIELVVALAGDTIEVAVTDNGVGLSEEARSTVFEMFTQVRPGGKKLQDGLGIGLTLVKQLAELHDGVVSVSSPGLGAGSTFSFTLPLRGAVQSSPLPGPTATIAEPDMKRNGRSLRILVVDDNVDAAEVLAALLEMNGYELRVAYDGQQALELAEQFVPDAIFLDIGMPGMSGFEVAKALRARPPLAQAAIIALTGWGAASDRTESKAAGFDHHLTKPTNFDDIEALLISLTARPPKTGFSLH